MYFIKKQSEWRESQQERAKLLFELYPDIEKAYHLSQELSGFFENTKEKIYGYTRLAQWYEKVNQSGFKSFNTISTIIQNHYITILNYFIIEVLMHRLKVSMQKSKPSELSLEELLILDSFYSD